MRVIREKVLAANAPWRQPIESLAVANPYSVKLELEVAERVNDDMSKPSAAVLLTSRSFSLLISILFRLRVYLSFPFSRLALPMMTWSRFRYTHFHPAID